MAKVCVISLRYLHFSTEYIGKWEEKTLFVAHSSIYLVPNLSVINNKKSDGIKRQHNERQIEAQKHMEKQKVTHSQAIQFGTD